MSDKNLQTDRGLPQYDLYLWGTGKAHKAYLLLGCHYIESQGCYRFAVWAPNAQNVSVAGDFNAWNPETTPMLRTPEGVWFAEVEGASSGDIYKYVITGADGNMMWKADPFAFHSETGPATGSKIWDLQGFSWTDARYLNSRAERNIHVEPVSIYELHLGSWHIPENAKYPWYRQTADSLAEYCVRMGYTHVELLPVMEYPFDGSWGYQVTGYFAPTSRYGTPQDFMYFVNRLHASGIGVIMDWVPAHFPKDSHGLIRFDGTPLYENGDPRMAQHPEWGTMIFDYDRPQVRSFLLSSAAFFLDFYHIDGLRVDAVSSMLYLDYGRAPGQFTPNADGGNICYGAVAFLKDLNTYIRQNHPGCITIAEEATAFPKVSHPVADGGLGFTFKWDMGYMHDTLEYMEMDPLFRSGSHNKLTFSFLYAFSEKFILAFSHDEVVHGKKSMLDKMYGDYEQKFSSLRALMGFTFMHPGKKHTFMGSDFGQFIEWDYKKSLDWFLLDYPAHAGMLAYMRELNKVYQSTPAMYTIDDSWDGVSWLNVDDRNRSTVAFMRHGSDSSHILCAACFTPVGAPKFVIGLPGPGILKLRLNSDARRFGGSGSRIGTRIRARKIPFLNFTYSAVIDVPPLSAVYYTFLPNKEAAHD